MARWSLARIAEFQPEAVPFMAERLAFGPLEAAIISGRTPQTVWNWIAADELHHLKIGGRSVISKASLEKKIGKYLGRSAIKLPKFMTIDEAAALVGVGKDTLRRWIRAGAPITTKTEDKQILICSKSFKKYLTGGEINET